VRNSLIGGAALLAIFAAILYNRWRIRRRMALRLEKLSRRQEKLLGEKEKLLDEKEWLLREINHRVKNNLQIIISLLRTQADQLKDEIAISAFEVISARINTISLVHRKLYFQSQNRTSINMRDYIHELVEFLQEGLGAGQSIAFHLEMGDLALDAAQCVPLGLILNEAITNAIKYAFPATGNSDLAPGISMPAGADLRPLGPGARKPSSSL
jgi:two-component system, sensor histidine kinase PdtaS